MAIELTDELVALEQVAWDEIQAGALTVDTAEAVWVAVAAHAEADTDTGEITCPTCQSVHALGSPP
ncbi:hypothetical protein AB0D04_36600 [Streptomyces sp. NPDC048483]|uniref:hypothetical protein n=1 Tax=Streptomyces sp. NPDC048483 TaxID=3154927 RepID=UPI003448C80D